MMRSYRFFIQGMNLFNMRGINYTIRGVLRIRFRFQTRTPGTGRASRRTPGFFIRDGNPDKKAVLKNNGKTAVIRYFLQTVK